MRAQPRQLRPNRLPPETTSPFVGERAASISPILKLIVLVIFIPDELSFYIFQFRLTLIRSILFLLTPVLLIQLSRLLASGKRHLVFSDIMIVLTGLWMILSPAVVVDLQYSLHHSAPAAFEFCGSYVAARFLLSERGQAESFVNLVCHVIAIVALFGVLDALTSRPIVHNFLRELTGYAISYQQEYRFGIFRVMGPIDHPILFGIVCDIGLLLSIALPIRAKALTTAACGFGVLLSLSSAPIQGAILGLSLLMYDRIFARIRSRWSVLIGLVIGLAALGIGASYAFGTSPFAFVFSHLTLDSASYWIRLYQWSTVGTVILNSPWFGIGFQLHEMAGQMPFFVMGSVDSLWLNLALVYGIPGATLVGLSMVGAACYPASGRGVNLTMKEAKLATTLGIVISIILLLGFTVDIWGAAWMFVGLLVGLKAHIAELGRWRSSAITKTDSRAARVGRSVGKRTAKFGRRGDTGARPVAWPRGQRT
jgi:O-antigen ligase